MNCENNHMARSVK